MSDFARLELKDKFIIFAIILFSALVIFVLLGAEADSEVIAPTIFLSSVMAIIFYPLFAWARGGLGASWVSIAIVPSAVFTSASTFVFAGGTIGVVILTVLIGASIFFIYRIEKNSRDPIYKEEKRETRLRKQQMKQEAIIYKREMAFLKKKQEIFADATAIKEYEQKLKLRYKDLEHQENVVKKILDHVKEAQPESKKGNSDV